MPSLTPFASIGDTKRPTAPHAGDGEVHDPPAGLVDRRGEVLPEMEPCLVGVSTQKEKYESEGPSSSPGKG